MWLLVYKIGVWEQNEGLAGLAWELAGERAQVWGAEHPALLAGERYDLLAVSPRAVGWSGSALECETVLLPGSAGALAGFIRARRAVSYGLNPRDTLTLSSIEGERISVALQRGLIRLDGEVVEEQEIVLPYSGQLPELVLAQVGLKLLAGDPGPCRLQSGSRL